MRPAAMKKSNARFEVQPGCAIRARHRFNIAKRKTAGTRERRSGTALKRGCCKATRHDQRALKGNKPHERRLAGPVDGLFKSSSASVSRTGDDGSSRSARKSGRGTRRRSAGRNRMTLRIRRYGRSVARDLARKSSRGQANRTANVRKLDSFGHGKALARG